MRVIKIIGLVVGGLLALLIIVLLAVWGFVNPNDYKGRIAQAVKDSTGRDLKLPGDIKLSVFPWIALTLGPASLGNPPGFGDEPFAAVKHAVLRVKLLPLLHKELQVGRIDVDGLDLRLKKDAGGKGNWEDFGPKPSSAPTDGGSREALQDLAGLILADSRIAYQDMILAHLNVDVGHVSGQSPVPVKISLDSISGRDSRPIHIDGKFDVILDMPSKRYRFAALLINGTYTPKVGAAPVPWNFSAPDLRLDLAAQTLAVPNYGIQLGAARVQGNIDVSKIVDAPMIDGAFKLDSLVLREYLGQLGMTSPVTRDARAFSKLAASGHFAYGANAVHADHLAVQWDDSNLRGSAAITNLHTQSLSFDLAIDRINIDRYLSPESAPPKPGDKPVELPTTPLKGLEAHGRMTIGTATISGVNLTQVSIGVNSSGGITQIAPAKAQLYGGQYSGNITLDVRTSQPVMNIDQTMTSIDVAALLKDFAKTQRLSGRGSINSKLTAHGRTGDALIKSMSGHIDANLANGAVEGIDLWYEINRAQSLLKQQTMPSGSSTGRTKFDAFKVSAALNNGVATTKDLNITSQLLRVTGQGYTNLVSQVIDYDVKATVLKSMPAAAENLSRLTLAEIPVKISGTMSNPTVRPDLQGIVKARVQQELDKHKDELKQKVQDQLQNLFKR